MELPKRHATPHYGAPVRTTYRALGFDAEVAYCPPGPGLKSRLTLESAEIHRLVERPNVPSLVRFAGGP
jgi:hypothetical protein